MICVYQDLTVHNNGSGNCVAAALASLLELPLREMPKILPNSTEDFWGAWRGWLRKEHKLRLNFCHKREGPPKGFGLVTGTTDRVYPEGHPRAGQKIYHMAVSFDGVVVHDPFPGGKGLDEILYYWKLEPISQDQDEDED